MNLILRDYLKIGLFALIIMVFTFQGIGLPIDDGIPPSFTFALNYFATHGIIFGHQVYYTYGPLGYLIELLPIKNHLFSSLVVNIVIRLLLIYNLFLIIAKSAQSKSFIHKVLTGCFFLLFFVIRDYIHISLFFLTVSYICLYNINQKNVFLILATFFSLLMLLEKPGFAVLNFSAAYAYLLLLFFLERKFKPLLIFSITAVVGYFAFWLIVYHSMVGSINYLVTIPLFTTGNILTMSTNPNNNWVMLLLSFLCFLFSCAAFIKRPFLSRNSLLAFALFLLPTYAMFKYGFTREDGHQLAMLLFLFLTLIFMLIIINDTKRMLWVMVSSILCIGLFYEALQSVNAEITSLPSINVHGLNEFETQIINFSQYQKTLRKAYNLELAQGKIPSLMLAKIGNQSVDIYNYTQGFIPANHLNWDPRPVFQTYASFMPYFDHLNANFFESNRKPQFLIWSPFDELDKRYILSTEPMTMYQIFKWYKPIMVFHKDIIVAVQKQTFKIPNNIYLLEKQKTPQLSPEKYLATTTAKWGDWSFLPSSSHSILRVKLKSQLSILGQIKTAVYKLFDVTIDYYLADNTILTYRLVYPNAINGVWVSPILKNPCQILNLTQLPGNSKVIAIRFRHDKADNFRKKIILEWYGIDHLDNAGANSCQVVRN